MLSMIHYDLIALQSDGDYVFCYLSSCRTVLASKVFFAIPIESLDVSRFSLLPTFLNQFFDQLRLGYCGKSLAQHNEHSKVLVGLGKFLIRHSTLTKT